MCISPIHIKQSNKSYINRLALVSNIKSFATGLVSCACDVPCGKCEACKEQKRSDYLLRALSEWEISNQHAIFVTLTYRDSDIPLVEVEEGDFIFNRSETCPNEVEILSTPSYRFVSTWYKPHVQKFFKTLNEKLIYFIGTDVLGLQRLSKENGKRSITPEWKTFLSTCSRPIKYLVTCERGSSDIYVNPYGQKRQGTSRVHYHAIIFINNPLLYPYTKTLLKLVKDTWTYGYSYNLNIKAKDRDLRSPSKCIQYVTKYITKDDNTESFLCLDPVDRLNRLPFVLVSKAFGCHLLDKYSSLDEAIRKGYQLVNSNGTLHYANIPSYNIKKRTHYFIKGEISPNSVVRRYKEGVYYDNGYFVLSSHDLASLDNDSKPLYYTKTILTKEGKHLQYKKRIDKANYYLELLKLYSLYTNSQSFLSLWNIPDTPLSNINLDTFKNLPNISKSDFYDYMLDIYLHTDDYGKGNLLYDTYECLKAIKSSFRKQQIIQRQIKYKLNLTKSIQETPELFNVQPL